MTTLVSGSASLVGQVRTANEDAVLVADGLAAVADGMGGHRAGEVASADTVEVLASTEGSRSIEDLVAGVHRANRRINERAAEDEELRGMGTTVCVVGQVRYDDEDQLAVLNVGDSRVYLLAGGELTRLTEDHSLVEALVREGRITAAEAEVHPQRNVLTRALGVEALVVVDAWLLRPCDGDRLLLCSDGLFNELAEDRITELLAEAEPPDVVARRLAVEAEAAGGRDNISTVVVDVSGTGRDPAPVTDRYRRITTPAVDLSDPDDGPRTDTVLAVVAPAEADPDDDDGDDEDVVVDPVPDVAVVAAGAAGPGDEGSSPKDGRAGGRWRTPLFVLAILAVVVLAVGAVAFVSRLGWVVGDDGGQVALFRGQKGGVLWIQPTLEDRSDLRVDELQPADRRKVEEGLKYSDEADARAYIANLEKRATSTTTTTTTTTTTLVLPTVTTAPAPGTAAPTPAVPAPAPAVPGP